MNLDNLIRIDLNLLVILQVLLEENSVTRAANRLHVSPSALSKSLTRLRNSLEDPLFTRTAHGLKPTAHALQLKAQLPNLLQSLYQLTLAPSFNPLNSDRHFSISMVESAYALLYRPIINASTEYTLRYLWLDEEFNAGFTKRKGRFWYHGSRPSRKQSTTSR